MFTFLLMLLKAHLPFAPQNMDYAGSSPVRISKSKNRCYTNTFKKTNNNNPKQGGSETKSFAALTTEQAT